MIMAISELPQYHRRPMPGTDAPDKLRVLKGFMDIELANIERGIAGNAALALDPYGILPGEDGVVDQAYPRGDIRRYGAAMNGTTDDQPAVQQAWDNALALGAFALVLPAGTIRTASTVDFDATGATPSSVTVRGYGSATIIRPSAAVAKAVTTSADGNADGLLNRVILRDLRIDGTDTTGATGLTIGDRNPGSDGSAAWHEIRGVEVLRFAGAGGVGIHLKNAVAPLLWSTTAGRNYVNLLLESDINSMPTAVTIDGNSHFFLATTKGIKVTGGYSIRITGNTTIESNGQEGLYIVPGAATDNVIIAVDHSWFQANCTSSGTYDIYVDGSAAGTIICTIERNYIAGAPTSVFLKSVPNFLIDYNRTATAAASIRIDTNCAGAFPTWDDTLGAFATVVSIDAGSAPNVKGPYS